MVDKLPDSKEPLSFYNLSVHSASRFDVGP